MSAVFETVLVEDAHVRLLPRHLARLATCGAGPGAVARAEELIAEVALTVAEPVVARIDVDGNAVTLRTRPPRPPSPVAGVTVEAYDPADASRHCKRADRAWADAAEAAAGGEALLVSPDGLVGETTRANVFAILGDVVVTPAVAGILPGVTRSWAIERTGAVERALTLAELRGAHGAFLSTAGRGIVALVAAGDGAIPEHPLTAELAAAWRAL